MTGVAAAIERYAEQAEDSATNRGNRGLMLLRAGDAAGAANIFLEEAERFPESSDAWYNLGLAYLDLTDIKAAEIALRYALDRDPSSVCANFKLASILDLTHRTAEAKQYAGSGAFHQGVTVRPCLSHEVDARILLLRGSGTCNLPARALFDQFRFETISTTLLSQSCGGSVLLNALPHYDIVLNCIADADMGEEFLMHAEKFCGSVTCPVLNAPQRIWQTRRDLIAASLEGIPGLVVPRTRRVKRATLMELAKTPGAIGSPQLIRPFGSHGGDSLLRLEKTEQLGPYLSLVPYEEFYLTEFKDYQSPDGYWRKFRIAFVDREVFPYHLAIGKSWMVHYWRAEMAESDWMKSEEERFLADFRSVFTRKQEATIREIARRLDLDYGGIDCGITGDGDVLLFEANASMLVHLDESKDEFPYKHAYVPRIFDAVADMVKRRVAGAQTLARSL